MLCPRAGAIADHTILGGFDSSVHISEEARNAKVAVPWTIMTVVAMGSLFGFGPYLFSLSLLGVQLLTNHSSSS